MTNVVPEIFEDHHLKVYSDCILQIGSAATRQEVDEIMTRARSALEKVKDQKMREDALQRLRTLVNSAYARIASV